MRRCCTLTLVVASVAWAACSSPGAGGAGDVEAGGDGDLGVVDARDASEGPDGEGADGGREDAGASDGSEGEGADGGGDVDAGELPVGRNEECECADPEAICVQENKCGLPEARCETNADCPDGFACSEDNTGLFADVCVCDGTREECGPFCEDDEDCPTQLFCERDERFEPQGFCRGSSAGCDFNAVCGRGEVCEEFEADVRIDDHCEQTGSKSVGESCSADIECESGSCSPDNVCIEHCLADEDCPEGEHCVGGSTHRDDCDTVDCDISCPEDTRCLGTGCWAPFCRTTSDCPEGDCIFGMNDNGMGSCLEEEPSRCKSNEVRTDEEDPYCWLLEPCSALPIPHDPSNKDLDVCPESYTCENVSPRGTLPVIKACGRRVVEE